MLVRSHDCEMHALLHNAHIDLTRSMAAALGNAPPFPMPVPPMHLGRVSTGVMFNVISNQLQNKYIVETHTQTKQTKKRIKKTQEETRGNKKNQEEPRRAMKK